MCHSSQECRLDRLPQRHHWDLPRRHGIQIHPAAHSGGAALSWRSRVATSSANRACANRANGNRVARYGTAGIQQDGSTT